jgi:predicted oxidoreductase
LQVIIMLPEHVNIIMLSATVAGNHLVPRPMIWHYFRSICAGKHGQ